MSHKEEKLQHQLYIELSKLQNEIIRSGLKLAIVFEGRDTAGKDGTIKAITRHLSPRETRVVALPKPSDRESHEWYFQRYVPHLPASGEMVIFNRSWYNRLGVEKVMRFCTKEQYESFFDEVKHFEKTLVKSGVILMKYYLDISKQQQEARLHDRHVNPLKQWKISPIDEVALKKWDEYTVARNAMLSKTDFKHAPWFAVNADDKDKAHFNIIGHLLNHLSYKNKDELLLSKNWELVTSASDKQLLKFLHS